MGVIKRGILGGFSGSVGNVVGSSWKGIATMKAKPLSVANPNTAGQQTQRTKMANIVAFAKLILATIIKPLNDRFASGQSGFNAFVSRNIDLFENADPQPAADLSISEGSITAFQDFAAVADLSGGTVDVSWTDNTGEGDSLGTDVAYNVAYNVNRGTASTSTLQTRADAADGIDLPEGSQVGDTIRVWGAFRRADGTKVSNTSYVTTVVVA